MAGILKSFVMMVVLVGTAGQSLAQAVLADPTRPPGGAAGDPFLAAESTGPVLQSVLIPKKGKPVAVIGGQQIRLGDKYGESRLIRLSDREAVLEGPAGIERLPLTPGIEKIVVKKSRTGKTAAAEGVQRGGNR